MKSDSTNLEIKLKELNTNLTELIKQRSYGRLFLSGIVTGLGSVVGATLVLTLIIYILSKLNFLPFVNYILDNLPKK